MLKEFKDFALKGNLIDIAVGLIMATAFGKVTSAFVDGIVMPLVGKIFQMEDGSMKIMIGGMDFGGLISSIINFIIIAIVMFLVIKAMNAAKSPAPDAGPPPPTQEDLLTQIRDLLKK